MFFGKKKFYYEVVERGPNQDRHERTIAGPLIGEIRKLKNDPHGYAYVQVINGKIQCALRKHEVLILDVDLSL